MNPLSNKHISAVENLSPKEFNKFLISWKVELDLILHMDPLGFIGHKCNAATRAINSHFPSHDALLAYVQPLTSWSPSIASVATIPTLHPQQPNLEQLASFCFHRFEWSPAVIHKKFERLLWPGVMLRMLCQVSYPIDDIFSI